jgi:hypothetical protein
VTPGEEPRGVLMPFPVREAAAAPAPTVISEQLRLSLAARDLAPAVYAADQALLRASGDVAFDELKPELADLFVSRAALAINGGDRRSCGVANEKAALAILRGVEAGIRSGAIAGSSPLVGLDITSARVVAKLAMEGGLAHLCGHPQGHQGRD